MTEEQKEFLRRMSAMYRLHEEAKKLVVDC